MTYYDYYGMHDVVEEYADIDYDKVKIASMNERVESDEEHPILGNIRSSFMYRPNCLR